jgi:hypothetical protein
MEGKPLPEEGTMEGKPLPEEGTMEGKPLPEEGTAESKPLPEEGTMEGKPATAEREGRPAKSATPKGRPREAAATKAATTKAVNGRCAQRRNSHCNRRRGQARCYLANHDASPFSETHPSLYVANSAFPAELQRAAHSLGVPIREPHGPIMRSRILQAIDCEPHRRDCGNCAASGKMRSSERQRKSSPARRAGEPVW